MDAEEMCEDDEPSSTDLIRLVLIVGMGTTVCIIGILLNTMLLVSFWRLQFRNSNLLYLFLLAVFDIFVELCFMFIFPSALIWEYFRVEALYVAWHHYIRYVSTSGQVLIAASTLLIVSASFERYICSLQSTSGFEPRKRVAVITLVLLLALVMKGSVYFELEMQFLPHCPIFTSLRLDLSELTRSESYKTIWMFWCRNFLNVFLPFSLLLMLNTATIANLNRYSKESVIEKLPSLLHGSAAAAEARKKKKDATRTLAALVTVYLLTNTLNLLLTIMEFIRPEWLRNLGEGRIYKYLADLSSLLTISSTATRLPVYFHCNREIRKQLRHFFAQFGNCRAKKEASDPLI
uniref:G_PROTEIN_RECEP_F1_2 domain-containing protein n=1 Tax=Haemonchus contortus TaxID=6289 RepID=A0A7I5EAX1_HAECO